MDFRVITSADGSYDNYSGRADMKILEGGALQVTPQDDRREKQIIYGPSGWFRVELLSDVRFFAR
jgi:hypothetical protein